MKQVKIATLWSSKNFGAYLQAYALQKYLKDNGYAPSFIKETKEESAGALKTFLHNLACAVGVFKGSKKYFYTQNLSFKEYYKIFRFSSIKDKTYAVVIGSDEIWNVANPYFKHFPMYVGIGCNSQKAITYAPSANITTASEFCKIYGKDPFKTLDHISVRDKSTRMLVNSIDSSRKVTDVLDPTFLVDNYNELLKPTTLKQYLFVYGYSFTEDEINIIRNIAKEKRLVIVSAGPYLEWTDVQLPSSPGEFLGLVQAAELVVTSTFHGTVFSIIFNKQFASFARNSNKIIDLLDNVGLSYRNASQSSLDRVFEAKIDYATTNKVVEVKRQESRSYLLNALK